jgi:histidyl-tRNA synthetase
MGEEKMVKKETVKGFQDFLGDAAQKRAKMKKIIQEQFELYGFEPEETPIIENEDFVRGDNSSDEAVSDIFTLQDKGKRKLALRYEMTFSLKRTSKNQKLPYRRYKIGNVFRDEPIREGRSRQFVQCDADTVGSTVKDEAENMKIISNIMTKLGIEFVININNRKLINEILESQNIAEKNKEVVIRELDKIDKLTEKEVIENLKPYGAKALVKLIQQPEKFFEKYKAYEEIKELKKWCKAFGVKVKFQPSLARGLSYYTGMVYEVKTKNLGVSISGGGSYIFNGIQSTGISLGFEPLFLVANVGADKTNFMVLSIGQDKEAIKLAEKIRAGGKSAMLVLNKSVGKALDYANSKGVERVVFVGKDEVKKGKFKVKDMNSGKEKFLSEKGF